MKRKWSIETGDGVHTVEYRRSPLGIVRVIIDGEVFVLGYVSRFSKRSEPFRVGEEQCVLTITRGGGAEIVAVDCRVERVKVGT
ncbi:MAG TPA: hypothetical protein GX011_07830 [Clostridiales bacterium]|jgi:hypothetical protein|nr:hypothetical protein [Clostridiales bacterium]